MTLKLGTGTIASAAAARANGLTVCWKWGEIG
jgi:hypothetical protein